MPLSASGRFIVDAHGKRVRLAWVNWYRASEDLEIAAGLDCTRAARWPSSLPGWIQLRAVAVQRLDDRADRPRSRRFLTGARPVPQAKALAG
jgi:hypothetical protein